MDVPATPTQLPAVSTVSRDPPVHRDPPIATLADGSRLRGVAIGDVDAYRGVPFALPPLGDRRFAPPAPLPRQPWGITPLNVTEYRPNCAQPHDEWVPAWPGLNNTFDEDCLYLNVFAPRDGGGAARAGQLPVLVFLFGGGWTEGGAADQQLYAWQSVLQTGDAVVVVPNYRLGALGWLSSWQLDALGGGGGNHTGDAGFLDQRAALRWAKDNAAAFGGDPNRLLLFGESAGAASVSMHSISPLSRGLFSRAAMQSGGFAQWASKSLAVAQDVFDWVAAYALCAPWPPPPRPADPAAAAAAAATTLKCLRGRPARELAQFANKAWSKGLPWPDGWVNSSWAPTRDGVNVPIDVEAALRDGGAASIPMLIGSNLNEGVGFVSTCRTCDDYLQMTIDAQRYLKWTRHNFPPPWAARVAAAYSLDDYTPFWAAAHAVGDLVVHCPTRRAAVALAAREGSNATGSNTSVFVYSFTHAPISMRLSDGGPCAAGGQGAFHGAEIPFVFAVEKFLKTPHERNLAHATWRYFRNFAYSGDPSVPPPWARLDNATSVPWPRFDNASYTRMLLGTRPDGTLRTQSGERARDDRCDLWDAYWAAGEPAPAARARPAAARRDVQGGGARTARSRAIYVDTLDEDEEDEVEQEARS